MSAASVLVVCLLAATAAAAAEYQAEYDLINDYLMENAREASDGQDYLNKADAWLDSMSLFSQVRDRLRRGPEARLAPALKQLAALRYLPECSYHEYAILRRNGEATGGRGRQPGSTRPVDQIVYEYSLAHAQHCRDNYPLEFEFSRHSLDGDLAQRVEALHKYYLRNVTYAQAFDGGEWAANKDTDVYEFLHQLGDPKIYADLVRADDIEPADVGRALVTLARKFPKAILLNSVLSENFESAKFYSLLLLPCDHYINRMDLFVGAQYDDELLRASGEPMPQAAADDQLLDYHLGWSKFNLCRHILDNQAELRRYWLENGQTLEQQAESSSSSSPADA